jgi:hypothetical protein
MYVNGATILHMFQTQQQILQLARGYRITYLQQANSLTYNETTFTSEKT